MRASGNAEATILRALDLGYMRRFQIRSINGRRVVDLRSCQAFEGKAQIFLSVAPIRPSEGLKDLGTFPHLACDHPGVGAKGQLGVKGHAENLRCALKGN